MMDILRSTGEICDAPSSSCFCTCVAYYSLNLPRMSSFANLLTLRSIGCRQSVQLAGMGTTTMLFSSRRSTISSQRYLLFADLWKHQTGLVLVDQMKIWVPCALLYIWDDNLVDVLPRLVFIRPVVWGAYYVPESSGNLCRGRQADVLPGRWVEVGGILQSLIPTFSSIQTKLKKFCGSQMHPSSTLEENTFHCSLQPL